MKYAVIIVPQAQQDIEEITYFIALDDLQTAETFVFHFVTTIRNTLSELPESGVLHEGEIRKLSYKRYTVFYRIHEEDKRVEIVHIINLSKPLSERGFS